MNNFGDIISKYRKLRGLKQSDVSNALNELNKDKDFHITFKAVSSWESGHTEPSLEVFFQLCRLFDIKDIYEEVFGSNPYNAHSGLNALGKERAREYVGLLLQENRFRKVNESNSFDIAPQLIRIYDQPASAGPGNFLDGDDFEEFPRDASVPAEASFGIRISGDSMKPFCNTSDVLWVHSQNTLEHNETGIFLLDGQAYCKKLQSNKKGIALISLNKKYQPIPVNEYSDFRVLGKVVGKR